jgi:fused
MGGNLFERFKKAELTEKEVANTVREACRALDFMHSNDIIHRDIKPENILIHEGTAKICDFGWAVHSPLLRTTQCGSPVYLSPEVIRSDLYDSKVDVWSIGILTYELLFRKIPFEINCISDLSKIVCDGISFKGREISAEAKEFILRCLSKNAKERMTIEQALDHNYLTRDNSRFRQTIN